MKLEDTLYLDFIDVLIKPRVSEVESRTEVDLRVDMHSDKPYMKNWKPIPIMSANMDTVTDIKLAFELLRFNLIPVLHKYVSVEDIKILFDKIDEYNKTHDESIDYRNLFISLGTSDNDKIKLITRLEQEPRVKSVCIDVANGYRKSVFEYIENLRTTSCKDKILMVGNVATPDAVIKYDSLDVDIVKLGIGPGSACTTRVQTGVGVPQISTILESKKALSNVSSKKTFICSDGGCKVYGDISKAFCAGADFVMLGGMFAGHEECPGTKETINGEVLKRFSGMAAKESQWSGVPDYGVEEGKTVFIKYRGEVKHTILGMLGGLRSTCTYTNSENLQDLIHHGVLIRSNVQENKIFS